jgi:hypothetical protein
VVLIVCEGLRTEPIYFKKLKNIHRFTNVQISVGGHDPVSLVESAKARKQFFLDEGHIVDKVWCVFDHDNRDQIFNDAIHEARNNGFEVAYSVPQFELWYLLHFQEQFAHIDKTQLLQQLKKKTHGYSKTKDYTEMLEPRREKAVRNAKKTRTMHKRDNKP